VALAEHEIEDIEDRLEATCDLFRVGKLEDDVRASQLLFRAYDPLRERALVAEERACELLRREPTRDLEGQRELSGARQCRVTAQEDQAQLIVERRLGRLGPRHCVDRDRRLAMRIDDDVMRHAYQPAFRPRGYAVGGPALESADERFLHGAVDEIEVVGPEPT